MSAAPTTPELASSPARHSFAASGGSASRSKFKTIVADPPWRTTTGPKGFGYSDGGHVRLEYPVMTLDEIKALPVDELAEDAAHLYVWTTNILVRQCYEVVESWGFKPSVLLTWAKNPIGMGLGDAFGITTEHVVFGHRGGLRPKCRVPTTWWNWKRGRHSAKPEAFQDMVESVSPGPYIELFARRSRLGWATWGNEALNHVELVTQNAPDERPGAAARD